MVETGVDVTDYNRIITLYQQNNIDEIRNIYNSLDQTSEKGIYFVIELILLFYDKNILEYERKLISFFEYLKEYPDRTLLCYFHIRKHLLNLYREEYSQALDELQKAAVLCIEQNDMVKLKWICFQELEISTFYLKNFSLSKYFIQKYQHAMQDSDDTKAYLLTVLAYISSHEGNEDAIESADKAFNILKKIKSGKEFIEDIYVRLCFVYLNQKQFDIIPELLINIDKDNPERFLIESYFYYNIGNIEASFNIFNEAYHKFYPKKRIDEYWLKYFILAADICEKKGNIEKAEGFYFFMLEQFDFIWHRIKNAESRNIFKKHYKLYLISALYFFKKYNKSDKLEQLSEKYSQDFSDIEISCE